MHTPAQVPVVTVTIDVLPDVVLLSIFDFHVVRYQDLDFIEALLSDHDTKTKIRAWHALLQVCRRWRVLVLGSPLRLGLQLCCTTRTPVRQTLDVWRPVLPLLIQGDVSERSVDNVVAQLAQSDRICKINLDCQTRSTLDIEKLWRAMEVPFPELAVLYLQVGLNYAVPAPVLPDSFLGGSAPPRLRYLALTSIPFPGLPNMLAASSATSRLVRLWLVNIPHSGYVSPEAMVTCLSTLTALEELYFQFHSPQSCPDRRQRPPPPTRSVLPALTRFSFKGVNEYLEEFLARIDTPALYRLSTTFFNDIEFDIPSLIKFTTSTFEAPKDVHVVFDSRTAWVTLQRQASLFADVRVEILCRVPDWQLSSLAQICTSFSPFLCTTAENLYIYEHLQLDWKVGIENTEWLELLVPFAAVKNLYLSGQFAPRIAPALRDLTGARTTEVLPALQNIFLEGFQQDEVVHEAIGPFISARQLTNHPVTILIWERDSRKERSSELG
jgi:hypothetical protein